MHLCVLRWCCKNVGCEIIMSHRICVVHDGAIQIWVWCKIVSHQKYFYAANTFANSFFVSRFWLSIPASAQSRIQSCRRLQSRPYKKMFSSQHYQTRKIKL